MSSDEHNYDDRPEAPPYGGPRFGGQRFPRPPVPPGGLYVREARFVQALLEAMQGRPITDEILLEAARRSLRTQARYEPALSTSLLKKAKRIMAFPNVRAHVLDLFQRAADFSPDEAARLHAKHIREGNFQALQAYWGLTLPKEPRAVEVKAAIMNVPVAEFDKARVPVPIAARVLGEEPEEPTPPVADEEDNPE